MIPPNVSAQHGAPVLIRKKGTETHEAYLLGVLSSSIFDWKARRWVDKNMTFSVAGRLTVPKFNRDQSLDLRLIEIAGRLAAVDKRYSDWAERVGVPVGSVKSHTEKEDLLAELDAVVAHLYGLDTDDLKVIWDTFHTTVDHLPNLDAVLDHFERWA